MSRGRSEERNHTDTESKEQKRFRPFGPRGSRIPGSQGLRDPVGYYGSRQADDTATRVSEQGFTWPYGAGNPARQGLAPGSPGWPVGETGPYVGRGPKGYRRSDERILEEVADHLSAHGELDASDIEVEVKGQVVVLKGTVEDRASKRLAGDIADAIMGVRDVENRVVIRAPDRQR